MTRTETFSVLHLRQLLKGMVVLTYSCTELTFKPLWCINFFQDHTKIIICPLMSAVTYVSKDKSFRTFSLPLMSPSSQDIHYVTVEFQTNWLYIMYILTRLNLVMAEHATICKVCLCCRCTLLVSFLMDGLLLQVKLVPCTESLGIRLELSP